MANSTTTTILPPINAGDTAFVIAASALVWLMTPGLAYFYAGMAPQKNSLATLISTVLTISVVTIQWFLFGYSLALSPSAGFFVGDCNNCVFQNMIEDHPNAPTIPHAIYWFFQLTFAIITPALALGSVAGRCRPGPFMVFVLLWTTVVYDFIAYWVWAPSGWLRARGALDFAGGTAVHISSGFASLALAIVLGRGTPASTPSAGTSKASHVLLGTALLWFGWFGFNGGSELAADGRATLVIVNTQIAAAVSGVAWVITDMFKRRRLSILGYCSGAVAGLVVITPACGFVAPWAAFVIGGIGGCVCCFAIELKHCFGVDDTCDVFGVHGVGGVVGCILTGIFTSDETLVAFGAAPTLYNGLISGDATLLVWQIVGVACSASWSFGFTFVIAMLMRVFPILALTAPTKFQALGLDQAYLSDHGDSELLNVSCFPGLFNATTPNQDVTFFFPDATPSATPHKLSKFEPKRDTQIELGQVEDLSVTRHQNS